MDLLDMLAFGASVVLPIVAVIHVADRSRLRLALGLHGRTDSFITTAVWLVPAAEVAAGVLGAIGSARDEGRLLVAPIALYAAYGAYLGLVLRRTPGVACGCDRHETPVSIYTVARPLGLLAAVGLGALPDGSPLVPHEIVLSFLAASGTLLVWWHLPAALAEPSPQQGAAR